MPNFYQSNGQRYGNPNRGSGFQGTGGRGPSQKQNPKKDVPPPIDTARVILQGEIASDLYSTVADDMAKNVCGHATQTKNKSTQIRKFYDELVMWDDRMIQKQKDCTSQQEIDKVFRRILPYVQMLRAKVAYSKGRKLVDVNFEKLMNTMLEQISSPEELHRAKLFFESFLCFMKGRERN